MSTDPNLKDYFKMCLEKDPLSKSKLQKLELLDWRWVDICLRRMSATHMRSVKELRYAVVRERTKLIPLLDHDCPEIQVIAHQTYATLKILNEWLNHEMSYPHQGKIFRYLAVEDREWVRNEVFTNPVAIYRFSAPLLCHEPKENDAELRKAALRSFVSDIFDTWFSVQAFIDAFPTGREIYDCPPQPRVLQIEFNGEK